MHFLLFGGGERIDGTLKEKEQPWKTLFAPKYEVASFDTEELDWVDWAIAGYWGAVWPPETRLLNTEASWCCCWSDRLEYSSSDLGLRCPESWQMSYLSMPPCCKVLSMVRLAEWLVTRLVMPTDLLIFFSIFCSGLIPIRWSLNQISVAGLSSTAI